MWYSEVYPYTLEEDLGSGLGCDTLLVGGWNGHHGEWIKKHEYTIISMLG
jgi:hypothetical protein